MELDFLNLFCVLLAAWLAGWLATKLGYPAVLGELLAGVILGPPLLGFLHGSEALFVLAEVGVLLMMLYIGMEIDPRELKSASWAGLLAAVGGFFIPFVLVYFVVTGFGGPHLAGLVAGISAGVTSLAVNSRILLDLKILDTRISHVMMAGALVADILSLLVFSAVLGIVEIGELALTSIALVLVKAVVFFSVTIFVGHRVFPYLGRLLTRAGLTGRTFNFTLVLIIAVLFGELAEIAGLHAILGAFIAGLFLRENVLGLTLSRDLRNAVQDTSIGLLTPIFFVTAGFQVSFNIFQGQLVLFLVIVAAAAIGKTLGTALFYLPGSRNWRESLVIGVGMNGRGGVDIILVGIALQMGIISQDIFSILVFMAVLTTAAVPAMLKGGVGWLRQRGELIRSGEERLGTVLIGAGPLARALARLIGQSQPVTLIDSNEQHCIVSKSEGLQTVHGSALQEQVLSEANAGRAERLIAMTPNVEINTLVSQLAREVFLVPEVLLLQSNEGSSEQTALLKHLGADILFASQVDLEEWVYRIGHGKILHTLVSTNDEKSAVTFAKRLHRERAALPIALLRGDEYVPFHDNLDLLEGDQVFILVPEDTSSIQRDRFDRIIDSCTFLDLQKINSAEDFFETAASTLSVSLNVDKESLSRLLVQSETWSSTVLAPGLAVPHILLTGLHPFQMLVARSRNGIYFPGHEDPVHIIFVLVSTREERNFHLRALSAIAQIAQDDSFEKKWMSAADTEELRRIILEADRRRFPESSETE